MTEVILKHRRNKGKKKYKLPLLFQIRDKGKIDDVIGADMQLFYMNVESDSDKLIVYLHGGAYVEEMLPFHWLMLDKITANVDATFRKVLKYYPDKKIIFMGDSAGGGLALGLSMYVASIGLMVPDKLILLSPWVDLLMDNPEIKNYLKVDPTLKYDDLSVDAAYWANGTDLKDYRLSPIYGDLSVLKDVSLFCGTHEFFYPDIVKFSAMLKEKGVKNSLYVGEGLNHVFPAFPIPEADLAIREIVKLIQEV